MDKSFVVWFRILSIMFWSKIFNKLWLFAFCRTFENLSFAVWCCHKFVSAKDNENLLSKFVNKGVVISSRCFPFCHIWRETTRISDKSQYKKIYHSRIFWSKIYQSGKFKTCVLASCPSSFEVHHLGKNESR